MRAITGGVTFGHHDVPFPEVAVEWLMNIELDPVRVLLRRPRVIVDFTTPLRDVAATLNEELVGAALVRRTVVIDGAVTHPEGIVSERDISRAVAAGLDLDTTHAGDVMAVDLASARADDTILRVAAGCSPTGSGTCPSWMVTPSLASCPNAMCSARCCKRCRICEAVANEDVVARRARDRVGSDRPADGVLVAVPARSPKPPT